MTVFIDSKVNLIIATESGQQYFLETRSSWLIVHGVIKLAMLHQRNNLERISVIDRQSQPVGITIHVIYCTIAVYCHFYT